MRPSYRARIKGRAPDDRCQWNREGGSTISSQPSRGGTTCSSRRRRRPSLAFGCPPGDRSMFASVSSPRGAGVRGFGLKWAERLHVVGRGEAGGPPAPVDSSPLPASRFPDAAGPAKGTLLARELERGNRHSRRITPAIRVPARASRSEETEPRSRSLSTERRRPAILRRGPAPRGASSPRRRPR
jgi:hypothetical protein